MRVKQNDGDRVENVIDNPCSYVAWANRCEELEQQLAESHRALRAETTAHENTQMQLEKMAAENAGLKAAIDNIETRYMNWEGLCDAFVAAKNIETPATDAFLAEVRAQGVEMFADSLLCPDLDDTIREFAAQLRQEAAQ